MKGHWRLWMPCLDSSGDGISNGLLGVQIRCVKEIVRGTLGLIARACFFVLTYGSADNGSALLC